MERMNREREGMAGGRKESRMKKQRKEEKILINGAFHARPSLLPIPSVQSHGVKHGIFTFVVKKMPHC